MNYGILVLSLATAMTAIPPAHADDEPSKAQALALYKDGLALADQARVDHDPDKYETALRKFLAAYSLVRRPNILYSIAVTEKNLGRAANAMHDLRRFVREGEAESKQIDQAKKLMAELVTQVASLRLEAPAGAQIFVDGTSTEQTAPLPDPIDLSPGRHAIQARSSDKSAQQTIDVRAGQTTNLDLEFLVVDTAQPPPPAPASASVIVPPPAVAETAAAPLASAPSSARVIASVAMGVLGVAGIGTGIGFLVGASDADSRVHSLEPQQLTCPQPPTTASCQELSDALHSRTDDTNLGRGLVAGGAVLVGVGIATWLLWPSATGRSMAAVPVATRDGAGGWLVGRF